MEENSNTIMMETTAEPAPTSVEDLEPKMKVAGTVERLELYGAFIDIGVGVNALIHISQLSNERVNRVSDVLNVGDQVSVWVDKVDPERNQIMVTMVEPLAVDWSDLEKGQSFSGSVTRLENYGAFVDIGAEREGLVHISEISHDYVKHPSEVLSVGDEVQVQVLGFSKRKRRIDLSIKNLVEKPERAYSAPSSQPTYEEVVYEAEDEYEDMPNAMEIAFRRAMGDESIDEIGTRDQRRKGRKARKSRGGDRRRSQDDLLARTLEMQGDE